MQWTIFTTHQKTLGALVALIGMPKLEGTMIQQRNQLNTWLYEGWNEHGLLTLDEYKELRREVDNQRG